MNDDFFFLVKLELLSRQIFWKKVTEMPVFEISLLTENEIKKSISNFLLAMNFN